MAKRHRVIHRLRERGDTLGVALAESFTHVLPPRLGGALALLENNAAGADVLFCAHTGLEHIATFADLWRGTVIGNTVQIEVWRVPFADIPASRDAQIAWLLEQWSRVDRFVEKNRRSELTAPLDGSPGGASTSS
jgi:hypothetical protein